MSLNYYFGLVTKSTSSVSLPTPKAYDKWHLWTEHITQRNTHRHSWNVFLNIQGPPDCDTHTHTHTHTQVQMLWRRLLLSKNNKNTRTKTSFCTVVFWPGNFATVRSVRLKVLCAVVTTTIYPLYSWIIVFKERSREPLIVWIVTISLSLSLLSLSLSLSQSKNTLGSYTHLPLFPWQDEYTRLSSKTKHLHENKSNTTFGTSVISSE